MNPGKTNLIAVVDDEPDILNLVAIHLAKAGFACKGFVRATELSFFLEKQVPDLIVLDLMLPDMDGLDVCRQLKKDERFASIPILMLTARGDETDVVLGLELGADDYVVKPFSPKVLVARIKSLLRRRQGGGEESAPLLTIGGILTVDLKKHAVHVAGGSVELTSTEFAILKILSRRIGWVFSREQILDLLWGDEKDVIDRTVDVHIRHLREKLGPAGALIKNIRGAGYKIEP